MTSYEKRLQREADEGRMSHKRAKKLANRFNRLRSKTSTHARDDYLDIRCTRYNTPIYFEPLD
jgi:hypothetical protein